MKRFLVILLALLLPLAAVRADEPSVAAGRTAFSGSMVPMPPQAHDLTADQPVATGEPVTFQIALRLQEDGRAPEAAYATLVRWLQEQGLAVNTSAFPLHTEIEASGTVGQVGKVLAMRFGRVEIDGRAWVAAVSAPSLPTVLGGSVIGINGLQPFAHMNKGPILARPAAR